MIWLMMAILRPRLHLNSLQSEFYLDYIQKIFFTPSTCVFVVSNAQNKVSKPNCLF